MASIRVFRHAIVIICLLGCHFSVSAHEGRRFHIQVIDNKMVTQGVNTERTLRFKEPAIRPYVNVLHDHWVNYTFNGQATAVAFLPGFDIEPDIIELHYKEVVLNIKRFYRWLSPPERISGEVDIVFEGGLREGLTVSIGRNYITSASGLDRALQLTPFVTDDGALDIDLKYELDRHVADEIIVIEVELSVPGGEIESSDSVFIILGPPGYKYHQTLMYLERYLSSNLPVIDNNSAESRSGEHGFDIRSLKDLLSFLVNNAMYLVVICLVGVVIIVLWRGKGNGGSRTR